MGLRFNWLVAKITVLLLRSACAAAPWQQEHKAGPPLPEEVIETVRLQIFLDRNNYGPGVIDGIRGFFTNRAAKQYSLDKRVNLLDDKTTLKLLRRAVRQPFTQHEVTALDMEFVGPLPKTPQEQSKQRFLCYETVVEFVAERYKTTPNFLRLCNPEVDLRKIVPGTRLWVPNVVPFKIEQLRRMYRLPKNDLLAKNTVDVSLRERFLRVQDPKGQVMAYFPITPGALHVRPPLGRWRVLGIYTLPVFRWDDTLLKEGVRSENAYILPPGPNSPVGVVWAGLNRDGIGIHGTNSPETIGRATSSGCIRLSNWDAVTFTQLVSDGSVVIIRK